MFLQKKMNKLKSCLILYMLAAFENADGSTSDYCRYDVTLAEVPDGILNQLLSLLTKGTISYFNDCSDSPPVSSSDVKLWLFTRNNPNIPILLDQNSVTQMDLSKKIVFLVHGWLCNITNSRFPQLKDAYLRRYDANIVGVDWTKWSIGLYTDAACSVPKIAEILGNFLCHLNVDLSKIHMVGHSLGAHISGLTGQVVQGKFKQKLGRVTGLDPAGPLFEGLPPEKRLDGSDASFVDVIHTNEGVLGYSGNCGTVDFYPNCGSFQPGCVKTYGHEPLVILENFFFWQIICNHIRAVDYMAESVSFVNTFRASCHLFCLDMNIPWSCLTDFGYSSSVYMGEDCPSKPKYKQYFLTTNAEPPYSKN